MKKSCQDFVDNLSALVDGQLPAARRGEVEAHVAGCEDCRKRVNELRKLAAGIAALPKMPPAPQFLAAVRHKILEGESPREEGAWESFIRSAWVRIPIRVAAVVVIFLGLASMLPSFYDAWQRQAERPQFAKAEPPAAPQDRAVAAPAAAPVAAQPVMPTEEKAKSVFYAGAESVARGAMQTVVVEADDARQVQAQATQVALALNGRVKPNQSPDSRNFYVELPASSVGAFRQQLMSQNLPAKRRQLSATNAAAIAGRAQVSRGTLQQAPAEPTTLLEIQVVPPSK